MPIMRFDEVSLAFGAMPLLDQVSFQVDSGERICFIGRNGVGKSSLLKVVEGIQDIDGGTLWRQPELRISALPQELPKADEKTVYQVVAEGLAEVGELLTQYHQLTHQANDEASLQTLAHVQSALEQKDGWRLNQRIETMIKRLNLPEDKTMAELSGGWRRRVILAQALVSDPELLLLDEPTNHLDIAAIEWLEQQLAEFKGAVLFITHDRSFLQKVATRIIELDRGLITSWSGDYASFLAHKAHQLEVEASQNAEFDKKLAQEEAWIRQGIKARRTRNEGRVRALQALRKERAQRREVQGKAKLQLDKAEQSGKLVVEAEHVCHGYDEALLIDDFSCRLLRGDRVGLIGPNGVGKSTLLRLLLGQEKPQSGTIKHGTKLEVAYFDQLRLQLDEEKTVLDNVADGRDSIEIGGKSRHIMSYLQDFLFTPERIRTPVKALSGGERNRLLLARMFSKPANMLVMDEPTNDLDVETLELLEEALLDFNGTLLLVSHDRTFLDNVVTSTFVFEGNGQVKEYVGGYHDWIRQGGAFKDLVSAAQPEESPLPIEKAATLAQQKAENELKRSRKKLSYKLQRELEQLPEEIEDLEQQQSMLEQQVNAPDFYQQEQAQVQSTLQQLTELQQQIEDKLERWTELEAMQSE
ncbi:ATP-binding cassette domain-containing protein [Zooshikella ganghwensis]|uniref:ATP-binding cassette ATPase Uup n=1 Tax=Zooshikella ganghwensis TaxID=202772 RepID=UPI00041E991E|nr:ATP-binding cassette domain-containing protein [Zooshikella ganghwensis]